MRLTESLVSFISRRTAWSEGHVFAIVPEQIGIGDGLRAGCAIGVMLAATLLFDVPDMAWSAIAAFWVCLTNPAGPRAARIKTLLTFTGTCMVALAAASYGAHWGPVAGGAALVTLVLLCGLTRVYPASFGPGAPHPGLIASIAVVIGVATPRPLAGALALGGYTLLGAAWGMALCLYLWPLRSDIPARRALVAIGSRLDDMAASLAELDASTSGPSPSEGNWTQFDTTIRRAARIALERGAQIIARADAGGQHFTRERDAAGHVFAALVALGRLRETGAAFDAVTERPLLDELARLLHMLPMLLAQSGDDGAALRAGATALLDKTVHREDPFARAMHFAADALVTLASQAPAMTTSAQEATPAPPPQSAPAGAACAIPGPVWRHAVRVALAVLAAYCAGHWLDVALAYWGCIATIVVMQPLMANTWLRVLERAVGSLFGGAIAATVLATAPHPAQIAVAVTVLAVGCIMMRVVSYGVFVIFLAPMFMLLSDFIHPAGGLIAARVVNEGLGAVVGLLACLVMWPERQQSTLADAVGAAVKANLAYAAAVMRAEPGADSTFNRLRSEAGVASARAETARERLLFEGRARAARLDQVAAILLAVRAVCGAAMVLRMTRAAPLADPARADAWSALAQRLQSQLTAKPAGAVQPPPQCQSHPVSHGAGDLDHAIEALVLAVDRFAPAPSAPALA
jgi:uncharacterized membrane protein YccC